MFEKLFTLFVPFDLVDVFVDCIQRTELLEQLLRRLGTDRWDAGHVVHRVSYQRLKIDHLVGTYVPDFLEFLGSEEFVFSQVQHRGQRRDQLPAVLVASDQEYTGPIRFCLIGQRGQNIVGFKAGDRNLWDPEDV